MRGRLRRCLQVAAAAVAFGAAASLLGAAVERAAVITPPLQVDMARAARALAGVIESRRAVFDRQIVLVGDSMLLPEGPGADRADTVPGRLERALARSRPAGERLRVHMLAQPGAGPSVPYFLSGILAEARPDAVVLELNLEYLGGVWRRTPMWARPDLGGWLPPARLPEAVGLPLYRLGLPAGDLLWLRACVQLACEPSWSLLRRQQLRVRALYEQVRGRGRETERAERGRRLLAALFEPGPYGPRTSRRAWGPRPFLEGPDLDRLPLALTAGAVRSLEQAGVPTLVYVTPVNVEHMTRIGVYEPKAVAGAVRYAERLVVGAGGRMLDLHGLLGDSSFRDASGHLTQSGEDSGADRLARELSAALAPLLASRDSSAGLR